MSNRKTRKSYPPPTGRPPAVKPAPPTTAKPYGPGYQKGQQAARMVIGENPWQEHADIIRGFKEAVNSELLDRAAKLAESAAQINNALKALEQ